MSENVVSIGKASIVSERREAFLQAVAQTFERYVSKYGYEPDAIVYIMNGTHQPSLIGWDIQGQSQGGAVSVLALAGAHVMAEAQNGRQGL
ncbi:hypothetical protein [Caulobacter sp. UC70_42]|uniref:hypothetical protein n=1 Tax=Caulobacter sp. UC70_42 TaxID=3374551 RepID=UPI00375768AA